MKELFTMKKRTSVITSMQRSPRPLKVIAALIITTLLGQQVAPTLHAAQEGKLTPTPKNPQEVMSEMHEGLQGLSVRLEQLDRDKKAGKDTSHVLDRIETLKKSAEEADAQMLEAFGGIEKHISGKKLPPEIMKRHKDMVKHYKSQHKALLHKANTTMDRERGGVLKKLNTYLPWNEVDEEEVTSPYEHFNAKKFKRSKQHFDPEVMPSQLLKPNPDNKPKLDKADFTLSGLHNTPLPHYAALGDFNYDALTGASDPAYLAESDEVVLTDDIKAKAAELNYDAVTIYHWVRNNIEWIPAWGSAQNAQLTLEAMRGNSMDIASLTVALLRASKIPARYVHGTIRVPSETFNNWSGGFESVMAAGTYAGSAGLPLQYIAEGGAVTHVHMEHVWVEAAADYYPSRGAKNRVADSWMQLDPSFKQYEFHEGVDVTAITGIDAQGLLDDLLAGAIVDETAGTVSSIDSTVLENALLDAQSKLEAHIDQNMTDPTVLDVIGGKKTIIQEFPALPSSLPNEILLEGARYAFIPASLQQTVTISLESTDIYAMLNGEYTTTFPYAKVNNEKVTLSFRPATEADEETIASYLPDGNITDISQLPSSLPAYLIDVIPEVKVNGEVVLSGDVMTLGQELDVSMTPYIPGYGSLGKEAHTTISGSYLSLNVIAQSVSPKKLQDLQARLEAIKAVLESNDEAQFAALTREEILGDMMYAGTLSYFAQLQGQGEVAGLAAKAKARMTAANGIFGYEPNVDYLFGLPQSISKGGIHLDIPIDLVVRSLDNDSQKSADFAVQIGTIGSTLEHQVPEQMFNIDPVNPVEAISAVKAMQIANTQGQKLYRIDQTNIDTALPNIHLGSAIIGEIESAVNAGKYVMTHTDNVSVPGWTGAGYIIIDPLTGEGAYMISGGENGAFVSVSEFVEDGFEQVAYALYTVGSLTLNNLDEIAALFWHSIVGTVANYVDNFLDVLGVFNSCNTNQGLAALAIMVMLMGLTSVLMSVAILTGGVAGYVIGAVISYAMAELFNMVARGISQRCQP